MCTVSLFDELYLEESQSVVGWSLTSNHADLACDQSNLVLKAAILLETAAGRKWEKRRPPGGVAALHKRIPIGAGLGGGSSDGARMLLGLNRLWDAGLSAEELSPLAAQLGSDVPFFLFGPSNICRGRGEIVAPIAKPAVRWAILILPSQAIATPGVYKRLDLLNDWSVNKPRSDDENNEPRLREPDWTNWTLLPAQQLLTMLVNDLEPPAFDVAPELAYLRDTAEQVIQRVVRMSGSGSTLFSLFDQLPEAQAAAKEIKENLSVGAQVVELAPDINDDLNKT